MQANDLVVACSDLDPTTYHEASDLAMESMTEYFEELIEDIGDDVRGSDVEYSVGHLPPLSSPWLPV